MTESIAQAAKKAGFDASFNTELKLADPRFGDLQLNGALAYAKAHGSNPREVAQQLVDALEIDKTRIAVSVAGPGFINFSYTPAALAEAIRGFQSGEDLSPKTLIGKRILIDFGSPNLGKQLHVGHFRTYNVGSTLARLLDFCGATVHRDNHPGDWGTTFGYIIYAIKKTGTVIDENDPAALDTIEALYKQANDEAKADPAVTEAARAETAKLQSGDPENTALWKKIVAANLAALKPTEEIFGTHYDTVLGESFYNDKVDRVYKELTDLGLAKLDQGALVVFHPEHPRFKTQPFIVRKSDGAANYASSDLATMLYRVEELKAQKIYIVTDARQSDHLEQLWLTTQKWFAAKGYPLPEFGHIIHGAVLGEDGKPLKTRSGELIHIKELFAEAIDHAREVVQAKSSDLSDEQKSKIARAVGIAAIRYADLCVNRTSDYKFSWDKMLSLEGNTAPYLLYAGARIHSLFDKLGRKPTEPFAQASDFATDSEVALARKLITAPTIFSIAGSELRPHHICTYLFELVSAFSAFYNSDRIMGEAADVVDRRLLLASKTLLVLETGLAVLGIPTLERM